MRVACEIVLTDEERGELKMLVRSKLTSVRLAQSARIVLLAADDGGRRAPGGADHPSQAQSGHALEHAQNGR
jgi:hypothetical protein